MAQTTTPNYQYNNNNMPTTAPSWTSNVNWPQQQNWQMQPTYTQPQYQQPQNNQWQQNGNYIHSDRVWSQGENAAKAYLVAKNTEQIIWDSEAPVIYIKTVDAYGKPSMVILDYTIRPAEEQSNGIANSEVNDLRDKVDKLSNMFEQFMQNQQQTKTYKPNYKKEGN